VLAVCYHQAAPQLTTKLTKTDMLAYACAADYTAWD
jgi:hypothetical protein